MTDQETQQLKALYVVTATYYQQTLDDLTVKMYAADLEDLPGAAVFEALQKFRRNPRNRKCPLPAEIRAMIQIEAQPEDLARETAAKIWGAVSRRGGYWEMGFRESGDIYFEGGSERFRTFREALLAELGPVGAGIIDRLGGWSKVHLMLIDSDPGIAMAQLRDMALSFSRLSAARDPQIQALPPTSGFLEKTDLTRLLAAPKL